MPAATSRICRRRRTSQNSSRTRKLRRSFRMRRRHSALAHGLQFTAMTELSLTILPETADDALAIERLHERTFGPGRHARTAYRIREQLGHRLDLSFTARIGTLLVGSARLTPIRIGEAAALLLGPLTIQPPLRQRAIGPPRIQRARPPAR